MISGIWLAGHVNWISRDGLEWVFGLNEHIRTGVCFGLNMLGGGRWFIHAGQGINGGGDHRSRKH